MQVSDNSSPTPIEIASQLKKRFSVSDPFSVPTRKQDRNSVAILGDDIPAKLRRDALNRQFAETRAELDRKIARYKDSMWAEGATSHCMKPGVIGSSERSDFEAFKSQGFAKGEYSRSIDRYRSYCLKQGQPYIWVTSKKSKFRIRIHLFKGGRFTEEGRTLLLAALSKGTSVPNQVVVGTQNARACIHAHLINAVLRSVLTVLARPALICRRNKRASRPPATHCDAVAKRAV